MGSPSSRLFWQTAALAGSPGNCQFGAGVADEGIAERLGQFVAERGYILESASENAGRNPARILANKAMPREISVEVSEIRVETKNAAAPRNVGVIHVQAEQKSVGEQVCYGDIVKSL
jgi:hypothetical protein